MNAFALFGSSEDTVRLPSKRPNPSVKGTSRKRAAPYVERYAADAFSGHQWALEVT